MTTQNIQTAVADPTKRSLQILLKRKTQILVKIALRRALNVSLMKLQKKTQKNFYSHNPEFRHKNHLRKEFKAIDLYTNVLVLMTLMTLVNSTSNNQDKLDRLFANLSLLEKLQHSCNLTADVVTNP